MGTVYRAVDERLGREVAVKEIPGPSAARAAREAKAAARLGHPCVATLYELAVDGDRTILVSELARGRPLGELLAAGKLTDREVAEVGIDVAAALAHAHSRGVVHRDVKPSNIVVELDPAGVRAKLLDFGIAGLAGEPRLTATGEVVGTLAYMAPEQADGSEAGPEADVYSLALTLYECWSGANPVAADTPAATARRIGAAVEPLASARADLPHRLTSTIDACLEASAPARAGLEDLAFALEHEAPALDCETLLPPAVEEQPARPPRGRGIRIGIAAGLVLTLWALAAAAGRPGLALVLGLLALPALFVASSLELAVAPLAAPLLAAASLGGAYPALAGSAPGRLERALLAALGWLWMATASLALSVGPGVAIGGPPEDGWTATAHGAASGLLERLASPRSLAVAAVFALAAVAFGWISRAHLALATVGVLLWAAILAGALRVIGEPGALANPLVALLGAIAILILARRPPPARRGLPAQPASASASAR
jgi:hypothetical protein